MSESLSKVPGRSRPAKGVHLISGKPNWVFLTVCTDKRTPWLADPAVQNALHTIWQDTATAWLVSDYLLMPDHLHLFCAPHDVEFTIERWISFWKDRLKQAFPTAGKFQRSAFHHRLRDGENYTQKWQYVSENPVRAGLVKTPEEWLFRGRVHDLIFPGS